MSRRGNTVKRVAIKDPVYGSFLVSKLINGAMFDGKKSIVQNQVYDAFNAIAEKTGKNPLGVFETALINIRPEMEVRPRRVGGAAYQVPIQVRGIRRDSLAIRWLISAARARSNSEFHTFSQKLATEIMDAANSEGGAVKKRLEVEKIAEANKAFSHFKW